MDCAFGSEEFPMGESQELRLGDWVVLPARNILARNGTVRRINPRTIEVLVYLADHAGEVVSADDLIKSVWRGTVVGDGSVYQTVNQARRALGSGGSPVELPQATLFRAYTAGTRSGDLQHGIRGSDYRDTSR
jgi:DNA-binding winged helix-turn-helix (wHTH) protein